MLKTPQEILLELAGRARGKRLSLNLTQAGLEQRSGVSLGAIKLFEHTGKISLESLVKIATALGDSAGFEQLFNESTTHSVCTIDEMLEDAKPRRQRKRGRLS